MKEIFGVAASTREIDLQNLTRVPRFGESIDHQKYENQTRVLGFELTDHEMDRQCHEKGNGIEETKSLDFMGWINF